MTKCERIDDSKGYWVCLCGNTPDSYGFYTCDERGNLVEPTVADWKTNYYRCDKCYRMIDQDTLEVVSSLITHDEEEGNIWGCYGCTKTTCRNCGKGARN